MRTFEYCFGGISYSKLTTDGMRNVLRLRAAVKAVDAESKSRSATSVEETLLDAEPVVTTVAQVAAPAPVAAPAAETTPAPGGSACKGEEGMKSEENGLGKVECVVLHHDT